jgi:hypothetical protein
LGQPDKPDYPLPDLGADGLLDDESGGDEEDRLLWREPVTVAQLGELMAQWLEGLITYQPGYAAATPDAETDDLVEVLATVNRAGLLTTFSQPGVPPKGGGAQRAAVDGFCTEQVADRLRSVTLGTDLVTLVLAPGYHSDLQVAVTIQDGQECTWLGRGMGVDDIHLYYANDVSEAGLQALYGAWQLHIIDPVWGRNNVLWTVLRQFAG